MINTNVSNPYREFDDKDKLFLCLKNDYDSFVNNSASAKIYNTFHTNVDSMQNQEKIKKYYVFTDYKVTLKIDKSTEAIKLLRKAAIKKFPLNFEYNFTAEEVSLYRPVTITVDFPEVTRLDTLDESDSILKRIKDLNLQASIFFHNTQSQSPRYQQIPGCFSGLNLSGVEGLKIPAMPEIIPELSISHFEGMLIRKTNKLSIKIVSNTQEVQVPSEVKYGEISFDQIWSFNPKPLEETFSKVNPENI
ncbi:MAG: hypothetical protein VX777_05890 [Chlamydiota bacterium]|nr:hypothetical protein [Chlamydiota bacterium]